MNTIVVIGLVLVIIIVFLFIFLWFRVKYEDWRSKHSWNISWISSREVGEPSSIKYTEKNKHFFLYGSSDMNAIIMPDKDLWEANMPEFWKDKWTIIKQRIETYIKRNTMLKLTNSIEDIPSIDCFDLNLPIGRDGRFIKVKFTNKPPV